MISATTADVCMILSHVYSICILWIFAQTDFSKRWEISVKTCRLPLPWLHTDLFHLGQLHFHAGSGHWVLLHEWNQIWGPGQCSRAQEHAPRPCRLTRNNVEIENGYSLSFLLLPIFDLPLECSDSDRHCLSLRFCLHFCTQINNT